MTKIEKILGVGILIAIVIAIVLSQRPISVQLQNEAKTRLGQITDTFTGDIFDAVTSLKLNGTIFYSSSGLTTVGTTTIASSGADCDYLNISGIDYADCQVAFTATSSIPAAIPNPFGAATSSILWAMVDITSGVTGANTYDLSTTSAANIYKSSSTPALIYGRSVATTAIDQGVLWLPRTASSTKISVDGQLDVLLARHENVNDSPFFLRPNEVLQLKIATSSPGAFGSYYGGTLSARFMKP